jgi:hypothetical protein
MARDDIRVWSDPHGQHGRIKYFRVDATQTFLKGEPVRINADGELQELGDDVDPATVRLIGIAAGDGSTASRDWRTDANFTTGATIPVIIPNQDTEFIVSNANFGTTSEAFSAAEVPLLAHIGDEAGLELVSGVWGVNIGATNNTVRIVDVLDANFESVQDSGLTGEYAVFVITLHQLGDAVAPAAAD